MTILIVLREPIAARKSDAAGRLCVLKILFLSSRLVFECLSPSKTNEWEGRLYSSASVALSATPRCVLGDPVFGQNRGMTSDGNCDAPCYLPTQSSLTLAFLHSLSLEPGQACSRERRFWKVFHPSTPPTNAHLLKTVRVRTQHEHPHQ